MLTPNCPECGARMKREVGAHDVGSLIGLPRVIVQNLPAFVCPQGHEMIISGRNLSQITQRLAVMMIRDIDRLGGSEVRYLRKYIQETPEQFARRLGTTRAEVVSWEKEPLKELEPLISYGIRSAVAGVFNQQFKGKRKVSLEPVVLRDKAHRRPNNYSLDFKEAA